MPRGRKPKQTPETPQQDLDFSMFNKIIGGEAILNNPYWMNNLLKMQDTRPQKIKRDDIVKWIENPSTSERELRQLNQYFLNTSLHYRRIINYFASILQFDYILIPSNADEEDYKSTAFKRSYNKVTNFLEDQWNMKDELSKLMRVIIGEDVVFLYERTNDKDYTLQKLPSNYCKIVSRDERGYQFAMDLTYFLLPGVNMDDFPPEFKDYVEEMKKGNTNTGTYWVLLDPDKAVCFKFDETIATTSPPLLGLFLDILEITEYKELIKSRAVLDNYMALFQRIPMNTDKTAKVDAMMISLDNATKFHANVRANVPAGVGVITSPMSIEAVKFDRSQNKDSIVGIAEDNFFRTAGVSQMLFSDSSSSVGLLKSIQADESFIIHMFRQFERWINWKLSKISGKYRFKLHFPDITYYNRQDKLDEFLNLGQFGMPKTFIAAAMGITPNQMMNLTAFESSLGIVDKLQPLASSHTTTGNEGGRPTQKDGQIESDTTVQTRDNESNKKRKGK